MDVLERIERGLCAAREAVSVFTPGAIEATKKSGGDPVTEADLVLDKVLRECLLEDGEGWLSEETVDSADRLGKERVWIVDPIDGTREFVEGIDEWCISIGYCVDGKAAAGGICNPARGEMFVGSVHTGVKLNGREVRVSEKADLDGATVLASRSEVRRGEWDRFRDRGFEVVAMGSVAYKLARVSAGLDDATFTLVPKNEWDVAAGAALVAAGGGVVLDKEGRELVFNRKDTLYGGMFACGKAMMEALIAEAKG